MLKIGEYFRCLRTPEGAKKEDLDKDTLVWISAFSPDEVEYRTFEHGFTSPMDEFKEYFIHEPKGAELRQEQMKSLMLELDTFQLQPPQVSAVESECTDLVNVDSLKQKKYEMSLIKAKVADIQQALLDKQEKLNAFLMEKKDILEMKLAKYKEIASVLDESIWTLNLYAGVGEEVVQLLTGKPALDETKVRIRQKLLYMDEECAINTRSGGIDFREITQFDEWVSKPANMQQVIPEEKAIVALRVRREKKEYSDDPFINAAFNAENMKTYFLIRNGENLYRLYARIIIDERLFPTQTEFDQFFFARQWHDEEAKPLRPGSLDYMKAMKAADSHRRHFMRILLILQGLFDRTTIFTLSESGRVNLLDKREYGDMLEFIHDDEMLLSDGRERFTDWLTRVNEELTVGSRIIGVFDIYRSGFENRSRLYPHSAPRPNNLEIYTIHKRQGVSWHFLFEGNPVWDRFACEHRPSKLRASCRVYSDDNFILNFDAATIDEMEFYISNRLDRHNYTHMIPLLRLAVEIKKREAREEAPFRKLLIGCLMRGYKISEEAAEKQIDLLINWWKFKNKTHRALTSDDRKALAMIVQEFGLRQKISKEATSRADFSQQIIADIRRADPLVMYVAHKKENIYVSYSPENEENIFAAETTWKYNGNIKVIRAVNRVKWRIIDNRHKRWTILWSAKCWPNWTFNPRLTDILTDAERLSLIEQAIHKLTSPVAEEVKKNRVVPLAATLSNHEISLFYSGRRAYMPKMNERSKEPSLNSVLIRWKRSIVSGVTAIISNYDCSSWTVKADLWEDEKKYGKRIWQDEKNIRKFKDELDEYNLYMAGRSQLQNWCALYVEDLEVAITEQWLEEERLKFIEDNHPSQWPKKKEELLQKSGPFRNNSYWDIKQRLLFVLVHSTTVDNLTVAEVVSISKQLGYKAERKDDVDYTEKLCKDLSNFKFAPKEMPAMVPPDPS